MDGMKDVVAGVLYGMQLVAAAIIWYFVLKEFSGWMG
jgi:hypothetical protein